MGVDSVQNNGARQLKERYSKQHRCLRMFFDKLPKLPAHYCRKETTKLYLEETFQCISRKKINAIFVLYKYNEINEEKSKVYNENKNRAREEKAKDKDLAERGECILLSMHLQAVKLSPCLPACKTSFRTKLCPHFP
nr:unnamed protein product [Callosobruchus chinensis]